MRERTITIGRAARYLTLGGTAAPVEEAWVACHGYGQLARSFLRPFEAIATPQRLIVAPEGLSRFYVDDAHRRVGASWMTREARADEIDDYVRWLDTAYADALTHAHTPRPERLVAFGFSQGCATIVRWLTASPVVREASCDRVILWGGGLPHDLDLERHAPRLRRTRLVLVAGEEDPFVTPERLREQEEALRAHAVPFDVVRFRGGHRVEADVLRDLAG